MANQSNPIEVDEVEVQRANIMWERFTVLCKWTTVATVVTLVLLALFLL